MSKGKEILQVVEAVSNEKNVNEDVIFEALEAALASATRKKYDDDFDVRVAIDRKTGEYETFRRWIVVDDEDPEFESPKRQILFSYAILKQPDAKVGDYVEESIESADFSGRIAAQTAKQVIVQKVREAERQQIVEAFRGRVGTLIMGTVKRSDRKGVFLDLGENVEVLVAREHMIPRENVRNGDRMRAYLMEVSPDAKGPLLRASRTHPGFLVELFKLEVPEVGQGMIDILGAARDPGLRAKIAVRSYDSRLDPVGACVGMRGSRVMAVSNELAGERVDIILWDDNPAQYVINAMSPAEVSSIVIDEDKHSMDIAVTEEKLSQAIGRSGQNVRLASQLTGWELNVMTLEEATSKSESEAREFIQAFQDQLDVDEEVASILVQEGFTSVEEIAYVPERELLEIDVFDEGMVQELRSRARDALLTRAIASEEQFENSEPADDLLSLGGMDEETARKLAAKGIRTRDDLAEQSVEELVEDVLPGMDEETAAALIMKAREHWFTEGEQIA
ncbi:MAG: transcription termination factor NusA [Thiotrichales bacterium]